MRSSLLNIFSKNKFFNNIKSNSNAIEYKINQASQILMKNIHLNWLRYTHLKTHKVMPIYIQKTIGDHKTIEESLPFGVIKHFDVKSVDKNLKYDFDSPPNRTDLELKLIIPQENVMQYFIQWQRYRKYWWSSITTTPSLFSIGDIKQTEYNAEVNIVARLPPGEHPVECIKIKNNYSCYKNSACLSCTMSLERALIVLLLDGSSQSDYLRLHRIIAPYKMSFGLNFEDPKKKEMLMELAKVLFHILKLQGISACLPDFSYSLYDQIKENLSLGIPYTAILNETTLDNGIFHLRSSNTTLNEQIHVADFQSYASLICGEKKVVAM